MALRVRQQFQTVQPECETAAVGFQDRLFATPKTVERAHFALTLQARQPALLAPGEITRGDFIDTPARLNQLDVHTHPRAFAETCQQVPAAVAPVAIDVGKRRAQKRPAHRVTLEADVVLRGCQYGCRPFAHQTFCRFQVRQTQPNGGRRDGAVLQRRRPVRLSYGLYRVTYSFAKTMTDVVPLLRGEPASPILLCADGSVVDRARFLRQVAACAGQLPDAETVINVCDSRHHFLVTLCAAVVRGQVSLMPPSRAPEAIADVAARYPGSTVVGDASSVAGATCLLPALLPERDLEGMPQIDAHATAVVVFTSGSTGTPTANAKSWGSMQQTTASNARYLKHFSAQAGPRPIVATVPPQHMYGMEMSVLLPLFEDYAVHEGRPFFPVDVAQALSRCPQPALLVSTPVHLRALLASDVGFPPVAGIVSATAPLSPELAASAEARFGCEVSELFGSTETCVIAHRQTARTSVWNLYDAVSLSPAAEGTWVSRAANTAPIQISDIVSQSTDGRQFELLGRHADLLEIAGKRASLADLNRLLLQVPGVHDGAMLQTHITNDSSTRRMAAIVVATASDAEIIEYLRAFIDPVFLPKRIHRVPKLPRNETGKLTQAALAALTTG